MLQGKDIGVSDCVEAFPVLFVPVSEDVTPLPTGIRPDAKGWDFLIPFDS